MRQKKTRAYLPRKAAQILVRPCGKYVPIEARFVAMAVPGDTETVAIGTRFGFMRVWLCATSEWQGDDIMSSR
jgi:hypothetical protein